jgi:predicted acylesterase/phospholipase RssA
VRSNEARAQVDLPPCDLVLKGGVTSAVIYARFLRTLSASYRFKRLGGTSAGAIGAAIGAVAQLARDRGIAGSFDRLGRLPSELGAQHPLGGSVLLNLFQPSVATRRVFRVVAATVDGDRRGTWGGRLAKALLLNFAGVALIGSLPGLWLLGSSIASMVRSGFAWGAGLTAVIGLAVTLLITGLAVLVAALYSTATGLNANHFGLCVGMPIEPARRDALTVWLHDHLNELLGRGSAQAPVTFGELWGAASADSPVTDRTIDLQVITTALNLQRPFRVPGDDAKGSLSSFFYDPEEWARFFPAEVLEWLRGHGRASGFEGRLFSPSGTGLLPLPEPADLPVIVAVRLSLSFPVLLSAVPMYMIDWTVEANRDADKARASLRPSKLYFSDGGLSSNFPIHLFDAPLPGHPTFGVDLTTLRSGERPVDRPSNSSQDPGQPCPEFPRTGLLSPLSDFAVAIFESARNWRDTMQQVMPGYRDRIVRIGQAPDEGGLKVGMTLSVIEKLGTLGERAAQRLVHDFAPRPHGPPGAWEDHRWTRMRSTLCMTQNYLGELDAGLSKGAPTYLTLPTAVAPSYYRFDANDAAAACTFMQGIAACMTPPGAGTGAPFCAGAPRPRPMLNITPSW